MLMHKPSASPPAGQLLREWRARRRRSQMDLALAVGVSTRHMSFVETSRSRPSPATLLAMAEELQVPLRERNRMLLAAGYAPRFQERPMDAPDMTAVRSALQSKFFLGVGVTDGAFIIATGIALWFATANPFKG